jgi:prepilin-type processing-associated H-X9-DG protein
MRWTDANTGSQLPSYIHDKQSYDQNHMGGPHDGGSPVLWADGSVKNYTYSYSCCGVVAAPNSPPDPNETAVFQLLWSYNRAELVNPPE